MSDNELKREEEVIDNAADQVAVEEETSNAATIAAKPSVSRSELIKNLVSYATKLGPEELSDFVSRIGNAEEMTSTPDANYASTQQASGDDNKNKASINSSKAPAEAMHSVKEDLKALFGDSSELSEDFRLRTEALFEAAVATRVDIERVKIEEDLTKSFEENFDSAIAEINENVDKYLNYAVAEWMQDNKLAVEANVRTEVAESFIEGLKGLFEDHYIDIPEEKIDVVEALAEKIEELEKLVNETTEKNIELSKVVNEKHVNEISNELSEGLTVTQKDKFEKLIEAIDYSDAEEFRKKASIIKETYFSGKSEVKAQADQLLSESVEEPEVAAKLDPDMAMYVSSLSRTIKR